MAGYIVASYLFSKWKSKLASSSGFNHYNLPVLTHINNKCKFCPRYFSLLLRKVRVFWRNLSTEQKHCLWGVVLGNLPDIDVLGTLMPFCFGSFVDTHRSFTHSLVGAFLFICPVATLVTMKLLGAGFQYSLLMCTLCITSHLLLDVITIYGTKLFWPFSNMSYTVGTSTSLDLGLVATTYAVFSLCRHKIISLPSILYLYVALLLVSQGWKRIWLHKVVQQVGQTGLIGKQYSVAPRHNRDFERLSPPLDASPVPVHATIRREEDCIETWIQPSNTWPNRFYFLSSNSNKRSVDARVISIPICSFPSYFGSGLGYTMVLSKSAMQNLAAGYSRDVSWLLFQDSISTILLIALYHCFYIYVNVRRKGDLRFLWKKLRKTRRILHDISFFTR